MSDEPRVVKETHLVELTDEECHEAGELAAIAHGELDQAEAVFEIVKDAHKSEVKKFTYEMYSNLRRVRERTASLELRVIHEFDWDVGIVRTIAIDRGGLQVDHRSITEAERQQHLFKARGDETPADDGAQDGGEQDQQDRRPAGA